MNPQHYVLQLVCPNRPGIVAAVSTAIYELGGNIREAQQFDDSKTTRFFARIVLDHPDDNLDRAELEAALRRIERTFAAGWSLRAKSERHRVLLMASRSDHCLADILYRLRIGELSMTVTAIVSNHPRSAYHHLDFDGIPFHHLPVTKDTKGQQEAAIWSLVQETRSD